MGSTYRDRAELAEKVRELRELRGMTQRALAEALDIAPASMNRIEKGERGIAIGELVGLADTFGVDVDALLRSDDPAYALRAGCDDAAVTKTLGFFHEVIADYFAAEALAR
jgi:transcriptional regulator with XRE-family HTH domain